MKTRVVGIGQPAAGDDGVGHAVIDALAAGDLPAGMDLVRVREASALLPLFEEGSAIIIVDALVDAGEPGSIVVLEKDQLDGDAMSAVSSHGIGVVQALELARALSTAEPNVRFVGVRIAPPSTYREGLSDAVARAVPRAVAKVLSLSEATDA